MASQNLEPRFEVSINRSIIGKDPDAFGAESWEHKSRTTKELLEELAVNGFAVIPAVLKGSRRRKDQFAEASLVMLDFDSGQTINKVLAEKFVIRHGLFAYSTHSHIAGEECQRFRLAIGLDTTITNRDNYEAVIRHLVGLLGSDPACTDACRLYFGNPEAEITWLNENPEPLSVADLPGPVRKGGARSQGSVNWSASDREKALICLEFIPPRGPKGSGTYPDSIRALFSLLNTFGEMETRALIEATDWQGDWDLEEVIEGAWDNPAQERGCGMGTLIQIAREHGMPANAGRGANAEGLINEYQRSCERIAEMMLTGTDDDWADIDLLTSRTSSKHGVPQNTIRQRVCQISAKLLGIDLSGETSSHEYSQGIDWDDLSEEETETKFLLPGVIKQNGSALLVAPGGVGKTEMACAIAKCIADGEGFLHYADIPLEGGKRTLFIEADMEAGALGTLKDYFISVGVNPDGINQWLNQWITPWVALPSKGIGSWRCSLKAMQKLKEELETDEYSLVVIDSLKKITAGTGYRYDKNDEMHILLSLLLGIVTPHASLLILHHTNKSDNQGMNAIGGASSIGELVDAVHQLTRKDEENEESIYTFETTKIRNGYTSCKFTYARNEEGRFYVVPKDPMGREEPTANRILCLLEKHWNEGESNGILRTSDIAKRLMLKDKTVSNKLTALKMASPQYVKQKGRGWKLTKAGHEKAKAIEAEAPKSMFKQK
jgi:RecA-family ATPase